MQALEALNDPSEAVKLIAEITLRNLPAVPHDLVDYQKEKENEAD